MNPKLLCPVLDLISQLLQFSIAPGTVATRHIYLMMDGANANGAIQFQISGQRVPLEIVLLREVSGVPGVIKLVDLYERPDSFILASYRDIFGQKWHLMDKWYFRSSLI